MTNTLAILLGVAIAAAILGDALLNGGDGLLFLARRLADLIEWLAFWR